MAERGGQLGNTNAVKGRRWAHAIERALEKRSKADGQKALEELAGKLLDAAQAGEPWALKELGDRLDGKPHQSVGMSATVTTMPEVIENTFVQSTKNTDSGSIQASSPKEKV